MGRLRGDRFGVAVTAVAMMLLVACGDDGVPDADRVDDGTPSMSESEPETSTDTPTPSTPTTPSPQPTPTPSLPDEPTPSDEVSPTPPFEEETPTPKGNVVTLTGVPYAGVEMNCWLLEDYLLLGGDRELIGSGQQLEITGQPKKDVYTTCQQGTPFQVESVTPAQ